MTKHQEKFVENLENNQEIITNFIVVLQSRFKEETNYKRPLISPQVNILYAVDGEDVTRMINFISEKIVEKKILDEDEFRFIRRQGAEEGGMHRFRLEFTKGVTCELIRKITYATQELEKNIP